MNLSAVEALSSGLDACCSSLQSQIDALGTITSQLQSQVDIIQDNLVGFTCVSLVISTSTFFDLSMVPQGSHAIFFNFDPCYGVYSQIPRVIFDPAHYGNNGVINIPQDVRIVFSGNGIVEMRDGVHINMRGTPACGSTGGVNTTNWPQIVIENGAVLELDLNATVTIGGVGDPISGSGSAGTVLIRNNGQISLNKPSHLVFGATQSDQFQIFVDFCSEITASSTFADAVHTNSLSNQPAVITFQKACFDIEFDNQSTLNVLPGGEVEFNTYRGSRTDYDGYPAEGNIYTMSFTSGSLFNILRLTANDQPLEIATGALPLLQSLRVNNAVGLARMAPNINPSQTYALGSDYAVDFNMQSGSVSGIGHLQFKEFVYIPTTYLIPVTYPQGCMIASVTQFPIALTFVFLTLYVRLS